MKSLFILILILTVIALLLLIYLDRVIVPPFAYPTQIGKPILPQATSTFRGPSAATSATATSSSGAFSPPFFIGPSGPPRIIGPSGPPPK